RLLAVAEQAPRELEEGVDPQQLRRHPQDRRAEQAARAEGGHQPAGRPAEDEREDRKSEAQRERDENGDDAGDPAAVLEDHERGPVEQAHGRNRPRHVPEAGRAPAGRAVEPHPQGDERDPRHEAVPELGKGQDQQHARERRERLAPQAVPQCAPPDWKTSKALYEERTKTPAYTVGNPSARASAASASKASGLRYRSTGSCCRVGRRYWPSVTI